MDKPTEDDALAYIEGLQRDLLEMKKTWVEPLALLVIFGLLGYATFTSIWAFLLFGGLAALIKGVADSVIQKMLLIEHSRAIFTFDGDSERLQAKTSITKILHDAGL